jgi:hypothetical protein
MLLHYLHCRLTIFFHYLEDTIGFTHIVTLLKKVPVLFPHAQVPHTTLSPLAKCCYYNCTCCCPVDGHVSGFVALFFCLFFKLEIQSLRCRVYYYYYYYYNNYISINKFPSLNALLQLLLRGSVPDDAQNNKTFYACR